MAKSVKVIKKSEQKVKQQADLLKSETGQQRLRAKTRHMGKGGVYLFVLLLCCRLVLLLRLPMFVPNVHPKMLGIICPQSTVCYLFYFKF